MRLRGLLLVFSSLLLPAAAQALTVDPGGPWRVAEGGTLELHVTVSGAVGTVAYAWDLDGDGVFDNGSEDTATFSAIGIDGPSEGFTVGLVVADDADQTLVELPVDVTNTGPEFTNAPDPRAVVGRTWTWTPTVTDAGGDAFELSIPNEEDMPLGMVWDALLATLTWTPNAGHLLTGEPPAHYEFRVTAEDEDNGRTNFEVALNVVENEPPPIPPIAYPTGIEDVRTAQPTIILNNVDDPDGDTLTYWLVVDSNPCFCSPELQESGGLPEGDFATEWRLPRPLDVEADVSKTYYVQRWTNDGIEDSVSPELSLFNVVVGEDTGGDADSDGDGDSDADADGDDDDDTGRSGCACVTGGDAPAGGALLGLAMVVGLLFRRRR